MKLQLAKRELFEGVQCDVWQDVKTREPYMTIEQLSSALGYKNKNGVEQLLKRNKYIGTKEYRSTVVLSVVEGNRQVNRKTTLFTEDGVMEVAFLSRQPKARQFRAWARGVLKAYMSGQLVWERDRQAGMQTHSVLTDTIHKLNLSPHYYKAYTDLAYNKVFGVQAKKLREQRGADKWATPRDYLTADELKRLNEAEMMIASLLKLGLEYQAIKASVNQGSLTVIKVNAHNKEDVA